MPTPSILEPNVGPADRGLRAIMALALVIAAIVAPVSPLLRLAGFGGMGAYLLFTAVSGTCLCYRLLGRSSCPSRHLIQP